MDRIKKTTKEAIEEVTKKNPGVEHSFIHFPRHGTMDTTSSSSAHLVYTNYKRVKELQERYKSSGTRIHTHSYENINPSLKDIYHFMETRPSEEKYEIIAQTNPVSGKVEGYLVLGKTKRTT